MSDPFRAMIRWTVLCCLAALLPRNAVAQIYVSNTGSDANPGTLGQPFATIAKAVGVAVAGDTIYVRGGAYPLSTTISITKSGTTGSVYSLVAYAGERPLLDFSSMPVSSSNRGIQLSGSYWHIKGLDIKGAGDNGMFVSGSSNVIEFCSFNGNRDTGLQLGGGASFNQVINCDSFNNADPSQGNADGFAPKLDVGTGNSFSGCRSWNNSDDGWDGYLRPSDDVTTTLDNCWCFSNGYLSNGSPSSGNGNGYKMGGSDAATLRHNMILTRCLSFDNRVKGFDQNHTRGSITLLNCTAYNNGTNFSVPETLATGKTLTVENCIAAGSGAVTLLNPVLATDSWLAGFAPPTGADFLSLDTTGVRGPRNADGSLPIISFMHLSPGSQFVDAGTDVGLPYNGSAPDLGAFESGAPMPIQLASFAAARSAGGRVTLSWETLSEVNNYGFQVQYRDPGGEEWRDVAGGFVAGHGTTTAPHTYAFVDTTAVNASRYYRLKQVDLDGAAHDSDPVLVEGLADIGQDGVPVRFALRQNYPNPFNPETTVEFSVEKTAPARLELFTMLGQRVALLFDEVAVAGRWYTVHFSGSDLASGAYLCRLLSGGHARLEKIILLK